MRVCVCERQNEREASEIVSPFFFLLVYKYPFRAALLRTRVQLMISQLGTRSDVYHQIVVQRGSVDLDELFISACPYCEDDDDIVLCTSADHSRTDRYAGLRLLHDICMEKSDALNPESQRFQANNSGHRWVII